MKNIYDDVLHVKKKSKSDTRLSVPFARGYGDSSNFCIRRLGELIEARISAVTMPAWYRSWLIERVMC